MYALVDCNSFYASCEQIFRPDLSGKPVVVLSNNDGCIVAANGEAKALADLPMWQPVFQYEELLRKLHVNVFSSNYALYADISNRVMHTLQNFSPHVEVYSIDEAFVKLEGFDLINLTEYGKTIRKTLAQHIGMPVGVGIAPTKTLAKVANHISKKFKDKLGNVYVIDSEDKRVKALKWLPIGKVWGIGSAHKRRLEAQGVRTAYDFTQLTDQLVRKQMGIVGLRLKHELEGKSCLQLEEVRPKKKAIGTAKSFGTKLTNYERISEALAYYVSECAVKLRKQKSCANQIMIFLHTNQFSHLDRQYYRNIVIALPQATNSTIELSVYAQKALKSIFKENYKYKKVGVLLTGLTPENEVQGNLFYTIDTVKHKTVMDALDKVNMRFGKDAVKIATTGTNRRDWKIKQEQLSPKYTTNWNDLLKINI